jgi:phospholipid N-methyltransferase
MKESTLFLKRFLKWKGKIGSLLPSSSFLAKKMAQMVPFPKLHLIVELGGGTGAVTQELLKHKKEGMTLVVMEPDEQFFLFLKKRFQKEKGILIQQERAENLCRTLNKLKLPLADCIVSSLPFASLGKKTSSKIFKEIQKGLQPNGFFVLYQYTPLMLPVITYYFKIQKVAFVPLNVPPAFVFCCTIKKTKQ